MQLLESNRFRVWKDGLKDKKSRAKISVCLTRMMEGNLGHTKSVGGGVLESIIDYGPGYRIYFARKGDDIIVMLGGSVKKSQEKSILESKELWKKIKKII